MTAKQTLGNYGETLAIQYLLEKNYTIIETQWHCRWGEIDIIAQKEGKLFFIEVKTRRSQTTETAFENLTPNKLKRITKSVFQYLHDNNLEDTIWRLDFIAVAIPKRGTPLLDYREDVLDW